MSAATMNDLYDAVRARILGYTDGATTVASLVGTRAYSDAPPDFASWPGTHLVLRVTEAGAGFGSGRRTQVLIEVTVFAKPRSARRDVRTLGDLVEGALLEFNDTTGAASILTQVRLESRIPVPVGGDTDREVVSESLRFSGLRWAARRNATA